MKLLDALRNLRITTEPTCVVHQARILELERMLHDERNELLAERFRRETIDRRYDEVCAERDRLNSLKLQFSMEAERLLENLELLTAAGAKLSDELTEERARREMLREQLTDAAAMLEEATSKIAVLEQQLRDLGATDEQLALIHAPASSSSPEPDGDGEPKLVSDTTREAVYNVVGLFFADRRYWLLSQDDGKTQITAAIKDSKFLERIHNRDIGFRDGDALRMRLQTQSWQRVDGSVFSRHGVLEVLEIVFPDEQIPLPVEKEPAHV